MTRPSRLQRSVCLALGANVGDRLQNLRAGLARLSLAGAVTAVSGLYQTVPVGVADQPEFMNAACRLETGLALRELLAMLKQIEWELGRRPSRIWGPRPLDIDIILASGETESAAELVVPHARMAERAFVLAPLAEIAGEELHPILKRDVRELLAALPPTERDTVIRIAGPEWAIAAP